MKKTLLYAMSLAVMLAMAASGCKPCDDPENPKCKNYDPCQGKMPVSAEFDMGVTFVQHRGRHPVRDTFLNSNTVIAGPSPVEFKGPDGYDSYSWKVGDDPREFTEQNFHLFFRDPLDLIHVQLIVSIDSNNICYSEGTGRDTSIQTLRVVPADSSAMIGRYRGVLASAPQDSFEVWIANNDSFGIPNYHLFNINPGCSPKHFSVAGELGYHVYLQKTPDYIEGGCEGVVAWAFLDSSLQKITIDYRTYFPKDSNLFTGRKIR